jgi:hypothetical protein
MSNTYNLEQIGQFFIDDASQLSVQKAYNEVGFFRRAIDIRRNGVANMPFDLKQGEKEITNEQTLGETDLDLVLRIFHLIPQFTTDLDLYGAAYAVFISDDLGQQGPGWMRVHPRRVTAVPGPDGRVKAWQVTTQNKTHYIPIDANWFMWIWQPNFTDVNIYLNPGQPIARAALTAAGILHYSGRFQSGFFERGALTPTLISIEGFRKLAQSARQDLINRLRKMFGGVGNAHQIHPIDGKTSAQVLQSPLKDMALVELSREQKETIAVTTGVPLSLLMSNASNYATATQDDFNFYDKAIAPTLIEVVGPQLNQKLFNLLGYNLTFVPTRLDAYQAIELQKSDTLNGMLDRNVIDINEYRASMGLEIIEEEEEDALEETELPEIFAYHIDSGVVSKNEVRERLGLPPETATGEQKLKDLQAQAKVMQSLSNAGIPPEEAAKLVGLPAPKETGKDNETENELKRWQKMAVKRYIEGKPEKALLFTSDIIPDVLGDKIKSALATVDTVDSVKMIFKDARLYNA